MPDAVDEGIEAYHRALDGFVSGDPEPLKALFSQRDDVTLANPFGPAQRTWRDVAEKMTLAAENYRDGRALGFDQIARYVTTESRASTSWSGSRRRLEGATR
jgi:hypothetical protein